LGPRHLSNDQPEHQQAAEAKFLGRSHGGLSQGGGILRFDNHLHGPRLLDQKITEGDLLGWQPPRLYGLVQSEDHVKGDAQQNLRLEAFIFHLRLRRQRDMSWSDGGLRRRHGGMSPGRGIILRFDNHQQGANLLNKKFAEGELLG
jgi:hypothetical protein